MLTFSFHLLLRICCLSSQMFTLKCLFVATFNAPCKENIHFHIHIHIHPFIDVYEMYTFFSFSTLLKSGRVIDVRLILMAGPEYSLHFRYH